MAMDDSFAPAEALRRFLTRSPDLQSHSRLVALSQKGDDLAVEDVENSMAELVLHPSYTVSVLGCFRAVGDRLVGKTVEMLRVVLGMSSLQLDKYDGSGEVGADEIGVIQFYGGKGRFLRLHEVASLAFCRALYLLPFLSRNILSYFSFAPPPFQRVLKNNSAVQDAGYLEVFRVSLRFLHLDSSSFLEMWDWSCFFDVVEMNREAGRNNDGLRDDIRWCGVHILLFILKLGEQSTECFELDKAAAFCCYKRWEEFCEDVALEKAEFYVDSSLHRTNRPPAVLTVDTLEMISQHFLSIHHDESRSLIGICKKVACGMKTKEVPFVLTPTLRRSFGMIRLSVSQKWPVLLHGPFGAGKSALISHLAATSAKQVLFLHMDEQMDMKALIGSYVCAEQPGEFRWQPGSLTQALQKGVWTVFEDIDKAPADVHSLLGPLLQSSVRTCQGMGKTSKFPKIFGLLLQCHIENEIGVIELEEVQLWVPTGES